MFRTGFLLLTALILNGLCTPIQGQNPACVRAKIYVDHQEFLLLEQTGLVPEHAEWGPGYLLSDLEEDEFQNILALGLETEILERDASAFYVQRAAADSRAGIQAVPPGFNLGSMGGFLTYNEFLLELDSMRMAYPNLISIRDSIGHSIENRPIFMLRISDNADMNEAEPEALYVGLHHAREPMSLMNLAYFMQHILASYGNDPLITHLLDHRELYFVPILNPDGYIYNELNAPNGGGMWRKNRRNVGGGTYGVDLNRNYGYQFAYDNIGSSPIGTQPNYRGVAAFSEPETQAILNLCLNHDFKTAFSYHAYGDLLLRPYGYDETAVLPDQPRFQEFGDLLTAFNGYSDGTPFTTVGYATNGSSDDWLYGEQTSKGKIMGFTPEIGGFLDGFWPAPSRIVDLCEENLEANVRIGLLAGDYIDTEAAPPQGPTGTSVPLPVEFRNLGLVGSGGFSASFVSTDPNIVGVSPPLNFGGLPEGTSSQDTFWLTLSSGPIAVGTLIKGVVQTLSNGFLEEDSVSFRYGLPDTLLLDPVEYPDPYWNGNWTPTVEHAWSPDYSMTDSPYSLYGPMEYNQLTLINPIDLTGYIEAKLRFKARWEVETNWDYVQVMVSTDQVNYTPLHGELTRPATGSTQPIGEPIYDGTQLGWTEEVIDLSQFVGNSVSFRFLLRSDNWGFQDGFYFDDFQVTGYQDPLNGLPPSGSATAFLAPNPGSGRFHVHALHQPSQFTLYNSLGQVIFQELLHPGSDLQLPQQSPGVYLYQIDSPGEKGAFQKLLLR